MKFKHINPDQLKAILFDSGHVLNRPRNTSWYHTEKFLALIDLKKIKKNPFRYAFANFAAKMHLYSNHHIKNESEEYHLFKRYYFILLRRCDYPRIKAAGLSAEIAGDIVFNDDKFIFFDDVESSMRALQSEYMLGIVSDTWPSLERVYRNKDLRDYFSCFVISSVYNSKKYRGKLFQIALSELYLKPEEVLFVDDLDINLNAAKKAGILPVKMDRYGKSGKHRKYMTVCSLDELREFLDQ